MTKLSDFNAQNRALLISVPYRIGIWISACDDIEKLKRDTKTEKQVLEMAIERMAGLHRKVPFAALVMRDILAQKAHWPSWENNADEEGVLADLGKALQLAKGKVTPAELKQYKTGIWQTAMLVAQSFDEQNDPNNEMHFDHFMAWLGSFIVKPKLAKASEHISPIEKTALKKLQAVLKG